LNKMKFNVIGLDSENGEIKRWYQSGNTIKVENKINIVVKDGVTKREAESIFSKLIPRVLDVIFLSAKR